MLTSLLGGGCAAQMGKQSGSAQGEELAVPSSAPWALSLSPSVSSAMFTNSSWNPAAKVWEEGNYCRVVTGPLIIPVTQALVRCVLQFSVEDKFEPQLVLGYNEAGCSEASKFICLNAGPSTMVLGSAFHGCVGHEPLGVRVSTGENLEMLCPFQYKRIQQASAMEPGSSSRWTESSSTFTLDFSLSRTVTDMFVSFIN